MAIDRERIIQHLSELEISAGDDGIIEGFNVFIQQLPASFWRGYADRLVAATDPAEQEAIQNMLVNAAHECGYHTGHGIMTSQEWNAVIAPMVEEPQVDLIHGAFAVLTAMGWADAHVAELEPGERMVVRATDSYEADGVKPGDSPYHKEYMLCGISAAFMDLIYGDYYPDGLHTFTAEQTKGIETGDEHSEFVVTRADA